MNQTKSRRTFPYVLTCHDGTNRHVICFDSPVDLSTVSEAERRAVRDQQLRKHGVDPLTIRGGAFGLVPVEMQKRLMNQINKGTAAQ